MKMMRRLLLAIAFLAGLSAPGIASQGTGCLPTTGTVSGLSLVTKINSALDALISTNSGASAPVTACSGASLTGQLWLDTSASPNVWKMYDGTSWLVVGTVDGTSHIWTPPVGGGTNSIVSAATVDLGSVPQAYVVITGATGPITSFGSAATTGTVKFVSFASTPTITNNAVSMILPTGANITAQAGDKALFVYLGGSNWSALAYTRADGTSLASASAFSSQISFTGITTPAALAANTDNWAPTNLATSSVIRASGTIDLNITGIVAQPTGTVLIVQNVGTTILTLIDDATSTAANRFSFGADFLLGPKQSILLRYDGTLSRWVGISAFQQIATQAQAEAGVDTKTLMTPLRSAQAIAALASSAGTDYQVFTSNGTWTKPSGTTSSSSVYLQCWGAGGGGGSAAGEAGGGGGGYNEILVLASILGATETVTIPAGGAIETQGGDATFGSILTAYGGGGAPSTGGGGGGGLTSKGSTSINGNGANGGDPYGGTQGGTTANSITGGGAGGTAGASNAGIGVWGGGGGGGGSTNGARGSLFGGGGGGADGTTGAGGISVHGGSGGNKNVAGSAPGGGGGRNAAGGRGECRATTFK